MKDTLYIAIEIFIKSAANLCECWLQVYDPFIFLILSAQTITSIRISIMKWEILKDIIRVHIDIIDIDITS